MNKSFKGLYLLIIGLTCILIWSIWLFALFTPRVEQDTTFNGHCTDLFTKVWYRGKIIYYTYDPITDDSTIIKRNNHVKNFIKTIKSK